MGEITRQEPSLTALCTAYYLGYLSRCNARVLEEGILHVQIPVAAVPDHVPGEETQIKLLCEVVE